MTPGSSVKVADFGLAKVVHEAEDGGAPTLALGLTEAGFVLGTPSYSAPEQLEGRAVDHRADIYSLGVLFYELLTGELPRGAFAPPSERSGTDKRLDHVVLKSMQPDPASRYQSAGEFRTEIDSILAEAR